MENLDFTFKKKRTMGELISDFISLYKKIFKHLHKNFLSIALIYATIFLLLTFFVVGKISIGVNGFISPTQIIMMEIPLILILVLVSFSISVFSIEYMFLLEKNGATNFSLKDLSKNVKRHLGKYVAFFFASIVVFLLLLIPIALINVILAFIPILGSFALMIFYAIIGLFFYCALFLYLDDRSTLWGSYLDSAKLIQQKMFSYGFATFVFQLLTQIMFGILTIVPAIILGVITFSTGLNVNFMSSFGGKFILGIGMAILSFFIVFYTIYLIGFYTLQYFSLIEVNFNEETMDDIEQIGLSSNE